MRIGLAFALLFPGVGLQERPRERVDFVRDVRPILEAACVKCHGAKKPRAQLRLDAREPALKGGLSGPAILPGKGAESLLVRLLTVEDEAERMPQKAPALSPGQIDLLKRWIDEGAVWPDAAAGEARGQAHWAYVKPRRPPVPPVRDAGWVRTPVDAFVLARLEREGLAPSPEAPRETLLRRVSLDLVGLPPSPEEIDAFLADGAPDAYERVVDRLLASPHYGERWARPWLDLARYADTNGFNFDTRRTMWKWRDWVVDALNRDLPFDRFTIEQIAGDLLPDATMEQRIATGFHRNTLTNEEGGTDPAEARWHTLVDRVATTATVWLGSTLACAQCHNHKYDPFSQKDFYRFLAFFETSEEPKLDLLTPQQRQEQARLRGEIAAQEEVLKKAPGLTLPDHIQKALRKPFEKRSNTERNDVAVYCRIQMPHSREIGARLLELYEAHEALDGQTALVLREKKKNGPPTTHVRIKGGFTNVGEEVTAGVPASLHPLPEGAPLDRLGLARWL
ncbi:MAG TPA: DUF1549 domain-containing protein, partial [Planctomycetota bacterium]|nr:DUF1549 domain-containing protein [Planctomycetota bacterium]